MSIEANLSGDGCRLVVRIKGYAQPNITDGIDANFLMGEVEVRVGMSAPFYVTMPAKVHTEDIRRFHDQLQRLDHELSGQAILDNVDSDFQATITLEAGKGTLAGIVREWATELRFKDVPIDQTYVHAALHEFGQLAAAFPVRGSAWG